MQEVDVMRPIALILGDPGKILRPGRHTLSNAEMSSWFIPGLIESGGIVLASETDKKKKSKELDYSKVSVVFGEENKIVTKVSPPDAVEEKKATVLRKRKT